MAHELTITAAGTAEMAYVGEQPWHGLGQQLEEGASIDQWRVAAGMDWKIQRSRVRYAAERGDAAGSLVWADQHVLFRSDTRAPLGIVSDSYKVVQPGQVLEFFRDLVADAGFRLHTAGTLFGGRKFWALAKTDEATIAGWDKVGGFVLLSTSSDGSSSTECRETSVRVVCNNTLSIAQGSREGRVSRTRHSTVFDADGVKGGLKLSQENFAHFVEAADALTRVRVSSAAADEFVQKLLRPAVDGKVSERAAAGEAAILALFEGSGKGALLQGSHGTAWGLVNAVTEYVDHQARAKTADHRLSSALFGPGDQLKSKAFAQALALV